MLAFDVLGELDVVSPITSPLRVGADGTSLLAGSACIQETILEEMCGGTGEM